MSWRSLFGAWYAEDVIRVRSNLTVSLGFRDEFSTGWNESHGRAANYTFSSSGIVCASKPASNICLPPVGNSIFTINRAKFLPQPRIGMAWSPFDQKTVIRAAFGMYNDLQDALGYRADQFPVATLAGQDHRSSTESRHRRGEYVQGRIEGMHDLNVVRFQIISQAADTSQRAGAV